LTPDVLPSRDPAVILINQLCQPMSGTGVQFYPSLDKLKDVYIDAIDRRTFRGKCGDVPIVRALRDAQLDGPH